MGGDVMNVGVVVLLVGAILLAKETAEVAAEVVAKLLSKVEDKLAASKNKHKCNGNCGCDGNCGENCKCKDK